MSDLEHNFLQENVFLQSLCRLYHAISINHFLLQFLQILLILLLCMKNLMDLEDLLILPSLYFHPYFPLKVLELIYNCFVHNKLEHI